MSFEFDKDGHVVLKSPSSEAKLMVFFENQLIEQFDSTMKGVIPQIPHYGNQLDLSYLRAWAHSDKRLF